MTSASGSQSSLGRGMLIPRRLLRGSDPADQQEIVERLRKRPIEGLVPIVEVRSTQDGGIDVIEPFLGGWSLEEVLPVLHTHITTVTALSMVAEIARSLAELHGLGGQPAPIHGQISLRSLRLGPNGEIRLAEVQGWRGRPREDVAGLVKVLRVLLEPKASKPGGAQLLDRLSSLRFTSADELYETIEGNLRRQAPEKLARARGRFISKVLADLGAEDAHREETEPSFPALPDTYGLPEERPEHPDEATAPSASEIAFDRAFMSEPPRRAVSESSPFPPAAPPLRPPVPAPSASRSDPFFDPDPTEAMLEPEARAGLAGTGSPDPFDRSAFGSAAGPGADLLTPFDEEGPSGHPTSVVALDLDPAAFAADLSAGASEESPFDPPSAPRPPPPPPRGPSSSISLGGEEPSVPPPIPSRRPRSVDPGVSAHDLMAPAAAPEPENRSDAVLVGDYRVVAAIGKGGMGEIYLARPRHEDRLVALKVLGAEESGDDEALGMLMDEAAIMARIEHPNVLKVVDFGRAHGRYYLASEYLEGRPLVRVMIESYDRDGGMEHSTVACIGAQAARGLHAAHTATTARGAPLEVVHRDVSPQNIFVTYAGISKVIDFGVARATERFSRTQIGLVKGKAAYMSPEQAEGRVIDARSDVFSLGICLWEMVAGKRLFKQPLDYDTLLAVQTGKIEAPSVVRGRKDPELDAIILGALERDIERRTPSAEAFAQQLEMYARTRGGPPPQERITRTMDRLFHAEAVRERALVEELSQTAPITAEQVASLRELSGVSQHGAGHEITFVAEPNALGVLDRYGEDRLDLTGERVLEKVQRLEAERRSGEYEAQPVARVSAPTPASGRRKPHRWPWLALAAVLACLAIGVAWWRTQRAPETLSTDARIEGDPTPEPITGPTEVPARALEVEALSLDTFVTAMKGLGATVRPERGPLRELEGLDIRMMLDDSAMAHSVAGEDVTGWVLELTPVDGGPAVVWLEEGETGLEAQGVSINDCPARAEVTSRGVSIVYGEGTPTPLELGDPGLEDVSVEVPVGATGLVIEPLLIAFGAAPGEGAASCPTGWTGSGQVILRRLPPGSYGLVWTGPELTLSAPLKVGARIEGGWSLSASSR